MTFLQRTVIVFILVGYVKCQSINDLEVDKVKEALEKGIGENFPDLPDLNSTNIPKAEDVEKVLREKCAKNGAENAVDRMKEEQQNAVECIQSYVNVTQVQEELETAKATGSMDDVFAKYCKKWPDIHACFDNSTAIARECLDKREESALNKSLDILNELQDFMCFKDGDRLAMFVAEKGVECIQERRDGVQECFNKTVGGRIPDTDDLSVSNLPVLLFTDQDCDDFETIRKCVNVELEKCKNSTPANIVDALFKFLKKHLPCSASLKNQKSTDGKGASNWSSSVSTLLLIGSFIYVRFF